MNDDQNPQDTRVDLERAAFELELPDGEDVSDLELQSGPLNDINYGFQTASGREGRGGRSCRHGPPLVPPRPSWRPIVRSYQQPHTRSPRALAKAYRFVELPLATDVEAFVHRLGEARPRWQASQWKWHRGTYFCVLRGGPAGDGPASELVTGKGHDAAALRDRPELRRRLDAL